MAQPETRQERRETPQDSYEEVTPTPRVIEPCIAILYDDSQPGPGMFHLLDCGHVIAIDGQDTRCGSNCKRPLEATGPQSSQAVVRSALDRQAVTGILPFDIWRRYDSLYCEVCQGIPADRYKFHKPPEDFPASTPRRCLALTRWRIVGALNISEPEVEALLATPFPTWNYEAHNLYCGHRVWCASPRHCAQNCADDRPCEGNSITVLLPKDTGVIFCQECVLRAERVHIRYEEVALQLELKRASDKSDG